jgi:hypothetical protein
VADALIWAVAGEVGPLVNAAEAGDAEVGVGAELCDGAEAAVVDVGVGAGVASKAAVGVAEVGAALAVAGIAVDVGAIASVCAAFAAGVAVDVVAVTSACEAFAVVACVAEIGAEVAVADELDAEGVVADVDTRAAGGDVLVLDAGDAGAAEAPGAVGRGGAFAAGGAVAAGAGRAGGTVGIASLETGAFAAARVEGRAAVGAALGVTFFRAAASAVADVAPVAPAEAGVVRAADPDLLVAIVPPSPLALRVVVAVSGLVVALAGVVAGFAALALTALAAAADDPLADPTPGAAASTPEVESLPTGPTGGASQIPDSDASSFGWAQEPDDAERGMASPPEGDRAFAVLVDDGFDDAAAALAGAPAAGAVPGIPKPAGELRLAASGGTADLDVVLGALPDAEPGVGRAAAPEDGARAVLAPPPVALAEPVLADGGAFAPLSPAESPATGPSGSNNWSSPKSSSASCTKGALDETSATGIPVGREDLAASLRASTSRSDSPSASRLSGVSSSCAGASGFPLRAPE